MYLLRKLAWLVAAAAVLGLCSCGHALKSRGQGVSLTVMHLNDTHSHLEPGRMCFRIKDRSVCTETGGFARIARKIQSIRQSSQNTLLLHAGDAVQGTLYFIRYQGRADFAMLNLLGLDAMAVGNHEFDHGPQRLAGYLDMADFPVVSANIDASGNRALAGRIAPWTICFIQQEPIGIIGLTTPETQIISRPGPDVYFSNPAQAALRAVEELKARGVNKIIALTHLGYAADIELAQSVCGIDLIVGGHSHDLLGDFSDLGFVSAGPYPTRVKNPCQDDVYIVQAWEHAKALGVVKLDFDRTGRIRSFAGNTVLPVGKNFTLKDSQAKIPSYINKQEHLSEPISDLSGLCIVEPDEKMQAALSPWQRQVEKLDHLVLGNAAEDIFHIRIPGRHRSGQMLEGGSMVAHLLCRAMLQKASQAGINADMALVNAGSVRGDIKAGEITAGDVYRLMPFETTMHLVELSGKQICMALNQGLEAALDLGRAGAFPCVAGARYLADAENSKNLRLRYLQISGRDAMFYPVDPGRSYLVLTNGFLARAGDGYRVFETAGKDAYDTGLTDADIFMDYIKSKKVLKKPGKTGITLITGEDPGYTDPEK